MRKWPVVVEFTEETRIIGGYLSVRQMCYLAFSFVLAGGSILLFWDIALIIGFVFAILFGIAGALLAFYKVGEVPLDEWLKNDIEYRLGQKVYIWEEE